MAIILTNIGVNKKIVYFEGDSGEELNRYSGRTWKIILSVQDIDMI